MTVKKRKKAAENRPTNIKSVVFSVFAFRCVSDVELILNLATNGPIFVISMDAAKFHQSQSDHLDAVLPGTRLFKSGRYDFMK